MRKVKKSFVAAIGVVAVALVAAACGSSSSAPSNVTQYTPAGVPTSGPGLTSAYAPSGTKVSGGTVYYTEGSDAAPNYIMPMYAPQVCSTANVDQLMDMMFRPLYWYGNNYSPSVDYSYSIGQKPIPSNGGKTYTIHLNHYKWSDGEQVTSRDLVFWMNMLKASPATEWCGYVPGYFPDNVVSYSAPNATTFVINFNKAYDPEWVLLNEFSQITPLPLAWDRTSLSQPAPTSDNGHLPDTTKAGASAVYAFLNTQGKDTGTWGSSPLWKVVDGPFKIQSFSSSGQATLVPNPDYSGSPKPKISALVELPFTSEAAIFNEMRSGGPNAITIGNLPPQYAPQIPTLETAGYVDNKAAYYGFNYFPMNFNSNASSGGGTASGPFGYIVRQLYFREAIQHLVDQTGWIDAFLDHTADTTYTSIPIAPPSTYVNSAAATINPYPFSVSAATQLLSSHGWKVVPGGTTTCQTPSLCGAGIKKGEGITFNIDYLSGVISTQDEMNDLAAQARKVGIHINLTTHPFATVIGTAVACPMSASTCHWTAQNWGAGWIYGPDYLPTGEDLFASGAVANYGSFSNPTTTALITKTITGPLSQEKQAMAAFATNLGQEVPVVFGPTSIGTFQADGGTMINKKLGGYAANALGFMNPEDWYFVK